MRGLIGPAGTDLLEQAEGNTGTEELAEMLAGEGIEGLQDVLLNGCSLCLWVVNVVGDDSGGEIGVVNGIVDGYGDLELGVVVHDCPCDTCPHRLKRSSYRDEKACRRWIYMCDSRSSCRSQGHWVVCPRRR